MERTVVFHLEAPPTTSTSRPKRRKVIYAQAYGYLLDPNVVFKHAIEDGTVIKGQYGCTFAAYLNRLARHCGIKYSDIITIHYPEPHMPPVYCVVAATNLSMRSKIPRVDMMNTWGRRKNQSGIILSGNKIR